MYQTSQYVYCISNLVDTISWRVSPGNPTFDLPGNIRSRSSRVYLYAYDTAIFVKGKSIDVINTTLNTELAHVSQWLQSNYLTLNVKKTKSMLIGTHQKLSRTQSKLNISKRGEHLDNVDQFKYLGISLDPSLLWSFHIDKLISKIKG